jgi:hypothetical protein
VAISRAFRDLRIVGIALDADVAPAEALGDDAGRAGAEERVEHDVAGRRRRQDDPVQQRFGLLGRMHLGAGLVLEAFRPAADRQQPVGAHLQVVVERLHGIVVEGVGLLVGAPGGPDQRLVGVGEAAAAEVRHRVGLAPHHVVEDPVAKVLQDGADTEDVVVAADHPQTAGVLQHPAALGEPVSG